MTGELVPEETFTHSDRMTFCHQINSIKALKAI